MIKRYNKILSFMIIFMSVSLFFFTVTANQVTGSEDMEENADTVMPYDDVITGTMDDHGRRTVYVDGSGYSACKKIKVFSPRNALIPFEDIEGAEEVKLFLTTGCIRKMKVLHFAE